MAHVYIKVSKDKYKLIEAIADTAKELAAICGTTENAIRSTISHGWSTYERVDFEDEEGGQAPKGEK